MTWQDIATGVLVALAAMVFWRQIRGVASSDDTDCGSHCGGCSTGDRSVSTTPLVQLGTGDQGWNKRPR